MTDFYKEEPLEIDADNTTGIMYYSHMYSANFSGEAKRHMCMQYGDWCWKQAREHPMDAVKFLLGRLHK